MKKTKTDDGVMVEEGRCGKSHLGSSLGAGDVFAKSQRMKAVPAVF